MRGITVHFSVVIRSHGSATGPAIWKWHLDVVLPYYHTADPASRGTSRVGGWRRGMEDADPAARSGRRPEGDRVRSRHRGPQGSRQGPTRSTTPVGAVHGAIPGAGSRKGQTPGDATVGDFDARGAWAPATAWLPRPRPTSATAAGSGARQPSRRVLRAWPPTSSDGGRCALRTTR